MTVNEIDQLQTYEVVVVGCGGWGLAVLKVLQEMGINALGLERGEICHNLTTYMPAMTVHSPLPYIVLDPDDPLLAQQGDDYHSTIEELIQSYVDFAEKYKLPIKTHSTLKTHSKAPGLIGLVVVLAAAPLLAANAFHYDLMIKICLTAMVAVGLNLLVGYAGQISLGHAAFLAVGAYTVAIVGEQWHFPFWFVKSICWDGGSRPRMLFNSHRNSRFMAAPENPKRMVMLKS